MSNYHRWVITLHVHEHWTLDIVQKLKVYTPRLKYKCSLHHAFLNSETEHCQECTSCEPINIYVRREGGYGRTVWELSGVELFCLHYAYYYMYMYIQANSSYSLQRVEYDGLVSPRAEQLQATVLGGGKLESSDSSRVVWQRLDMLVVQLTRAALEDVNHTIPTSRGKELITYMYI